MLMITKSHPLEIELCADDVNEVQDSGEGGKEKKREDE